jgi:Ribosomal protein L22p/L17e
MLFDLAIKDQRAACWRPPAAHDITQRLQASVHPLDLHARHWNLEAVLTTDQFLILDAQVNQAQKQRRRTYRAHGRINPYMCSPCHVELFLADGNPKVVPKEPEQRKVTKVQGARAARKVGGKKERKMILISGQKSVAG